MSVRVRLDIAYCGTDFHGWAAQPGQRTVEGVLGEALATLLRRDVRLTVAGRTDAGVHAAAQVAHVDIDGDEWARLPGRSDRAPADALAARLRGVLRRHNDLVIRGAAPVPSEFDARFSALGRHYRYVIADTPDAAQPWRRDVAVWRARLDTAAMGRAARALIGEHDFLPFARLREGATTIRTLRQLDLARRDRLVVADVAADAFCHSQVRFMIGALTRVGEGKRSESWISDVLAAGVRDSAVPLAPAAGLTLVGVDYPDPSEYARQADRARVLRTLDR